MINIQYKTTTDTVWHTAHFADSACFANWKYTFKHVVTQYTAFSNYRLIEKKAPKPFYLAILQWMF